MNLLINNISIISFETKRAKIQNFKKGINVVTSSGIIDGNYVGKSCILRSIFHTLGADGCFSSWWENEGTYLYLLEFSVDNVNYLMLRKNGLFKLFDSERRIVFSVSNRSQLAEELVKLFNQEIYLKAQLDGKYKLAHPAFNYLLNYIEQSKIEPTNFNTFNGLKAFKDIYEDLIYSHLGVNTKEYNQLIKNQKEITLEKTNLNNREKILQEVEKEIDKVGGSILDLNVLKEKLKLHEKKFYESSVKINEHKKKLNDAYNLKTEFEILLKELDDITESFKKELEKELKTHRCLYCDNFISNDQYQHFYFHKVKNIDGYVIQKLSVEEKLNDIKREIELESNYYESALNEIKNLEKEIFAGSTELKNSLKSLGLQEISQNIIKEMVKINSKIENINKNEKEIKKQIKEIKKKRVEVDQEYNKIFSEFLVKYPIAVLEPNNFEKAISKIKINDNHSYLATVIWLCSLLKTKYKYNPDSVKYPLIFDSPNNANLDKNNERMIFNLVFENLPENGQIITSSIGFEEKEYNSYKINKIFLENEELKLLNKDDFYKCQKKFSYLNLFESF